MNSQPWKVSRSMMDSSKLGYQSIGSLELDMCESFRRLRNIYVGIKSYCAGNLKCSLKAGIYIPSRDVTTLE